MDKPNGSSEVLRILLVEDNPNDLWLSRRWLEKADPSGFEVQSAMTIADALRLLAEQAFDLAVLDLDLPDSTGLASLHRLLKSAPQLPIVVLTGSDDKLLRAQSLAAGAQDYLVKGHFEPEYWLARTLRHMVDRHHLQRQLDAEYSRIKGAQELSAFGHMGQLAVPVTAAAYGQKPLADYDPVLFQELAKTYRVLLEKAIETQVYKVEYAISHELVALAEQLGFLQAGPRDVIELHSRVLEKALLENPQYAAKSYTDEGRLVVLELMGYLVGYYRRFYRGAPNNWNRIKDDGNVY